MDTNSTEIEPKKEESSGAGIEGSAALDISFDDILSALVQGYGKNPTDEGKEKFADLLTKRLKQLVAKYKCADSYNILVMYDNTILVKSDSDRIYSAITTLDKNSKPLLLVLLSGGGEPGSAYLIGKLCRESSNSKFVVVVPRYAKSAATLLACAADEIHMGSLSELGPIDPQINKMPALGLKNSIEHIAELVNKMPDSGNMFARYLYLSIEPIQIGYYERAAESAVQYAERLLSSHESTLTRAPADIAHKLVYEYKDHGFVIDKTEAIDIFGKEMIKSNSLEYTLGNEIYNVLSEVEKTADLLGYHFYFLGKLDSKPVLLKKRPKS